MKRRSIVGAALLVAGFAAFPYAYQASGQTDAGWITLFDGKNLDNFNQVEQKLWSAVKE